MERLRDWLKDLPPARGYTITARPLRYRTRPHLGAVCWYGEREIELQLPEPFRRWTEPVYYRARRRPGKGMHFQWFARQITFRTRREVLRFLYCHEFYHWYLKEVLGRKAAAETACDRFALAHFRSRRSWAAELPEYDLAARGSARQRALSA